MCKKIHRGGNAEQYNADKKYKEAVAEAVEACADDTKGQMLVGQSNLANTYQLLHRYDEALSMRRDVYSGKIRLHGEEHETTLKEAFNYATSLFPLNRFKEIKELLMKAIPVSQRVLGDEHRITFRMRYYYACSLYIDAGATLDDLREAVTTLEETERTARRVLGKSHPIAVDIEGSLRDARAGLRAREALSG